jgi:hypothetical protein
MVVKVIISYKKDRIGCFTRISILSVSLYSVVDFPPLWCLYKHGLCIVGLDGWSGGVEAFSWSV